ncbi:hypothetical protein V1264_017381 [Littorina saxatilis]
MSRATVLFLLLSTFFCGVCANLITTQVAPESDGIGDAVTTRAYSETEERNSTDSEDTTTTTTTIPTPNAATIATTTTTTTSINNNNADDDDGEDIEGTKNKDKNEPVVIGGAVGGGVLAVIVIAVIVVVVWRKKCVPTYAKPTRRSQVIDTNIYTGLVNQDELSNYQASEARQNESTFTQQEPDQDTADYVNVAASSFRERQPSVQSEYITLDDSRSVEMRDYVNVA